MLKEKTSLRCTSVGASHLYISQQLSALLPIIQGISGLYNDGHCLMIQDGIPNS